MRACLPLPALVHVQTPGALGLSIGMPSRDTLGKPCRLYRFQGAARQFAHSRLRAHVKGQLEQAKRADSDQTNEPLARGRWERIKVALPEEYPAARHHEVDFLKVRTGERCVMSRKTRKTKPNR